MWGPCQLLTVCLIKSFLVFAILLWKTICFLKVYIKFLHLSTSCLWHFSHIPWYNSLNVWPRIFWIIQNHISCNIKHTKSSTKKTDQVICFWQSRMVMSLYRLELWNVKYSRSEELLTGLQKNSQSIKGTNSRKIN